jgi:uncharacterized protein YutE (UPF0331/DUF86 family)/predicted nucleotidyltransferase
MKRDLRIAPKIFLPGDVLSHADDLARIFDAHGIQVALLFGSLAAGARQGGDLDLAVQFRDGEPSDDVALYEALRRLFRADNIDVVPLDRAPFLLRKRVLLAGRVLYDNAPGHLQQMTEDVLFAQADFEYAAGILEEHLTARLRGGLSVSERRLDRQRITAYLSQLDVSVRKLTGLSRGFSSFDEFMAREDPRDLAIHHLRIALECVLNICRHFLAVKGVSLQELDTTNLIELAGLKGLLAPAFAHSIRGMAGARNAIVHAYVNLEYPRLYAMLADRLSDFDEFGRQVLSYLEHDESMQT